MDEKRILEAYEMAKERYAALGVDTEAALTRAAAIPISMNCWQGDDVLGFDNGGALDGGIATTGSYPGRARTPEELRQDIDEGLSYVPGKMKLNLHANYANTKGRSVDRDAYTVELFEDWLQWAEKAGVGMDFNATYFSHPKMDGFYSLSSLDPGVRHFWVEHGKRCLEIAEAFAKRLGQPSVVNYWMADGSKDRVVDSVKRRKLMIESLDEILSVKVDRTLAIPAIESKLFGIGAESYTVANHEFSYGYAITRGIAYCLDAGHFHPTEVISAKISSALQYLDKLLLHVSRPVRWDSDHVVLFDDELAAIMDELIFNNFEKRVFIGTDCFDASINRIAAWGVMLRSVRKALLFACLAPIEKLKACETNGDYAGRLALLEERKTLPFGAVWDYLCMKASKPVGTDWIKAYRDYEARVLSRRN